MAVVVVHACDELAEGAADELLAVRAGPDEVRGGADQAADGQAQRELLPGANHRGALQSPPIRERESCCMVVAFQSYRAARFGVPASDSLGELPGAAVVTVPLSSSSREHGSGGSVGRGINGGDPLAVFCQWGGSRLCRESPQRRRYVRERDGELGGTVTTLVSELGGRARRARSRAKPSNWSLDASGGPLGDFFDGRDSEGSA